ncbi:MAG: SDR family NAD(P)-dependent oxidoreductase [Myxococcales bacterium]|nr:SDR family NAD(P)-dependent oxidoreductase [Myxococcales bacterium]
MKLTGNTVLITGGGSGIGLALAGSLLERENEVVVCARREEKLEAARRRYPGLKAHRCDVSDAGDRQRLLESIARDGLAVNVLINNAARMRPYDFTDVDGLDMEDVRQEIAANFIAPVELIHLFLPMLLGRPDPTIINVSSPGGVVPVTRVPVYCASKAALSSFTRSLRRQLVGKVRVIALYPPSVETEMMEGIDLPKISVEACSREIMRRLAGDDDEVWIGEGRYIPLFSRLAPGWIFEIVNRAANRTVARA